MGFTVGYPLLDPPKAPILVVSAYAAWERKRLLDPGTPSYDSVTSGAGAEEIESVCLNFESSVASCSPQGPIEAGLGCCVE